MLARLPFGYAVWQRLGLFRHGRMDSSEYAVGVFRRHASKAGLLSQLSGKTVLELGPGDSVASAVVAAAYGARAILVDTGRYVSADVHVYTKLARFLAESGMRPPDLSDCADVADVLNRCRATYLTDGLDSLRQVASNSVDCVFSQAVLEHVRRHQFLETMQQCRRVLKSGSVCSHQVDLRDHLGGALNNLRFSKKVWESHLFAMSGFYTNRIRYSEMRRLFEQAGFSVEVDEIQRWPVLPTKRAQLAPEFRALPDEELRVSGFAVLLRTIELNQ